MIEYPHTRRDDVTDTFHGVVVADPYRWLETTTDPEVRDWIAAQNEVTDAHLRAIDVRDGLRERIAQLWDRERRSVPWRKGSTWLQLRNDGLQNQDVLWTTSADPLATGTPDLPPDHHWRVLLDPNTWTEDGTASLTGMSLTDDGQLLAYARSDGGSDWMTWRVVDCGTGADIGEEVRWAKFAGAAWLPDGSGFVYGGYPEPEQGGEHLDEARGHELRLHLVGRPDDTVVYRREDQPDWIFEPGITHDDNWLVVTIREGTNTFTRVHLAPISAGTDIGDVTPWLDEADAAWHVVGALADELVVVTDKDAPASRVVTVRLDDPTAVREIIAESGDRLESAAIIGAKESGQPGRLVVQRLHHASARLDVHELGGNHVATVDLGELATVGAVSGGRSDTAMYVMTTTFAEPAGIIRVEVLGDDVGAATEIFAADLPGEHVQIATSQAFVTHAGDSDTDVRVPVFLVHRADVTPTGDVPTILYGYGGFDIPVTPTFSPTWRTWMERGGLLAVACLRGGGEYGKGWYDDGRRQNKTHVFDDAIAVAEWLAGPGGWTNARQLGIEGRSNGGLLAAACLTLSPQSFGCAVPEVGVLDMYRYHRFTIGWAWASDYGTVDDETEFTWLQSYSPLHRIEAGTAYPPTLLTTGDTDDRVVPGHSFKFAAALQQAQSGDGPVVIRIDTSAGHGAGKPTSKLIDERADVLAFEAHHLGLR